jgi:hypothetical protein
MSTATGRQNMEHSQDANERRRSSHPATAGQANGNLVTGSYAAPISLQEVNGWDASWQRLLFRILVPVDTLVRFGVDPVSLTDVNGMPVARVIPGDGGRSIRLEVYHEIAARDAILELELVDTAFNQIEVLWIAFQNAFSPRFDVDVMPDGQNTMRGFLRRNVPAEEAAMRAGLAPGQTRRGLSAFRRLAQRMETFMACLNQREYIAQPLFYHTAVLFERVGFSYIQGQSLMERIAHGFAPGGKLRARLDGSTPFRQPEQAATIRGRAWAVHDGILEDDPWDRVRMVKRLGVDAEINTTPGVPW